MTQEQAEPWVPKTNLGKMVMEVQELNDQKYVRWRCVEGPAEWVGTDITFQLYSAPAFPFNRSAAMGGLREGDRGLPSVHSPAAA